ncbi:Disease resistance protein [Corchorus capsularis]|uniref:Disease resistance protein n=1 Tax=Corchorus capsularis TaxID=210143 RepID=A0A1R3GQL2_COCAP|nr:Disease resistance protein [Corchorus capsularis]
MAESVVSNVATRLGDLVRKEAIFLWEVEEQVNRLRRELSWMKSFLRDADSRQAEDERLRQWVAEIRDIAYDAEDVIETYALKMASKRKGGLLNCMKWSACCLRECWRLHKVRSEIEEITTQITVLIQRLQAYGIKEISSSDGAGAASSSSSSSRKKQLRQTYPHTVESFVVGFENDIKQLASVLVDEETHCGRVASICGIGGLGKTTLARKVFHHSQVRNHFNFFVWAFVSQQFQRKIVWKAILSGLGVNIDERAGPAGILNLDEQVLAGDLYSFLKENKCLVVLDDIWSAEDWDLLRDAFPMEDTTSKILLTSRNMDVALHADSRGYLHQLQCLTDEDGWKLLQHVAFPTSDSDSADYAIEEKMEELGKDMVKQCFGLPLAIVVLGGVLAKMHSLNDWQNVHENVKSYLKRGRGLGTYDVLTLSYDNLPAYLKPCFLYLSVFPEDYEIRVDKLIQLWVAEDIVSVAENEGDGEEMAEDVAERYLNELVERYMVLVGKRDASLKIKTCRMHDLVRDLCLSKAKQENFTCIGVNNINSSSAAGKVRRLAMHDSFVMINHFKIPHLRSALFFDDLSEILVELFISDWLCKFLFKYWSDEDNYDREATTWQIIFMHLAMHKIQGFIRYICMNFKLLRVLHFEGVPLSGCKLGGDISSLIHLRYLSVGEGFFSFCLSSSISKLRCLQTLDLSGYTTLYVPDVFGRMERLRHLYLPSDFLTKTKLKLDNLRSMQTLINFNTKDCNLGDLSCMKNLRRLGIITPFIVENFREGLNLNPPIITSKHLRSLSIKTNTELQHDRSIDPRRLTYLLSSCVNIYELELCVKINKLPEPQHISSNIASICLSLSELDEDPLPTLEKFPKLRVLQLSDQAFTGAVMVCFAQGFPRLVSLSITCLENLEEVKVNEGAMPNLQNLTIAKCRKLKMLPVELKFITTLKELVMEEMPKAFKDKLVQAEEDYYKVQHVPSVIFQNCDD